LAQAPWLKTIICCKMSLFLVFLYFHVAQSRDSAQSLFCSDGRRPHKCPDRFKLKPDPETIKCFGGKCTDARCCVEVWRNNVSYPSDQLINSEDNALMWAKLTLVLEEQLPGHGGVYFQNSKKEGGIAFHYEFASQYLVPFQGASPEQFNSVTLFNRNRQAVVGAVMWPSQWVQAQAGLQPEFAIQISASEPPGISDLIAWLERIRSHVSTKGAQVTALYLPTLALRPHAEANREALKTAGFDVVSALRWAEENAVYSHGWAVGRLVFATADNITQEFKAGKLLSTDILLTDGVPAEVPPLAGIISMTPATPNSHVAILSQTYGNPFVFVKAGEALKDHEFRTVLLRAREGTGRGLVDVEPVELDPQTLQELLKIRNGGKLDIQPVVRAGYYTPVTRSIMANVSHFGGKAKNFPLLLDTIPNNTVKHASAFSFDLWLDFAELQVYSNEMMSVKEFVAAKLQAAQGQPQYVLDAALEDIRDVIEKTEFSPALKTVVIDALSGPEWTELAKIRFRSSTNVEDSDSFTGAGLYDSKSGCLADDLDDDEDGPSLCDSESTKEKGVFRALRKVWASFYNTNAYLARVRLQVPENEAGMAVLVHHNFPDALELANGVCTLKISYRSSWDKSLSLHREVLCVTQKGATSVTNAEPGFVAEEVVMEWTWAKIKSEFKVETEVLKYSSLTLLGELVLGSESMYGQLADLLLNVAEAYGNLSELPYYVIAGDEGYESAMAFSPLWLDFEYKNLATTGAARPEGGLVVKQVRPLPRTEAAEASYIMPQTILLESVSGHDASHDALANHRSKVKVQAKTIPMLLTKDRVEQEQTLFSQMTIMVYDECKVVELGPVAPKDLPGAEQQTRIVEESGKEGVVFSLSFRVGMRKYTLTFPHIAFAPVGNIAPLFLSEMQDGLDYRPTFWVEATVTYEEANPLDIEGRAISSESSKIASPEVAKTLHQMGFVDEEQSVTFQLFYYRSPSPTGISAGFTWSIPKFVNTTITGLTQEPMVLGDDYFVSTYAAYHHNFEGSFLFHLTREHSLTTLQRAELLDKGVAGIFVHVVKSFFSSSVSKIVYFNETELDGYKCDAWHSKAGKRLGIISFSAIAVLFSTILSHTDWK